MKKSMLLIAGLGIFAVSCNKKETQTNNNMNDSAVVSNTDTITAVQPMPMDSTATRDTMSARSASPKRDSMKK